MMVSMMVLCVSNLLTALTDILMNARNISFLTPSKSMMASMDVLYLSTLPIALTSLLRDMTKLNVAGCDKRVNSLDIINALNIATFSETVLLSPSTNS
jgi:hypothetical protein